MIEILKLELINKGSLIAKFSIKIPKWGGLVIRDCTLFDSSGKQWISFPSKEYESQGKKKYFSYIAYENQDMDKKFKDSILKAANDYVAKMKPNSNTHEDSDQGEFPF